MTPIIAYLATLAVFTVVDLVWLGFVMTPVFKADVPAMLAAEPKIAAAAVFYAAFCAGLVYFAVLSSVEKGSMVQAGRDGALIGLMAYGTYELTNMATLRDWTWRLVVIDMTWGAVLCGLAAGAGTWAALTFARS